MGSGKLIDRANRAPRTALCEALREEGASPVAVSRWLAGETPRPGLASLAGVESVLRRLGF